MSYPAGASLQLVPNSKFIIQNTPFGKLSEFAKVFYTPHTLSTYARLQLVPTPCATPFGKLSEFAKVFYTPHTLCTYARLQLVPNSKFIIQNSPNSHCKIFAKVGKFPPPIVKIMLNFTMYNVKFLFSVISLVHQLTTAKVQRRMSEGKSASWRS